MTGLVWLVLLAMVAGVGVLLAGVLAREWRAQETTRRLDRADRDVQREYRRARCDMNEAAGQSWRSLLDGDGDV